MSTTSLIEASSHTGLLRRRCIGTLSSDPERPDGASYISGQCQAVIPGAAIRNDPQMLALKADTAVENSPTRRRPFVVKRRPENQIRVVEPSLMVVAQRRLLCTIRMRVIKPHDFVAGRTSGANGREQRLPVYLIGAFSVTGCDIRGRHNFRDPCMVSVPLAHQDSTAFERVVTPGDCQ